MATSLLDMDDRPRPSKLFPLGTLTTTKEYQTNSLGLLRLASPLEALTEVFATSSLSAVIMGLEDSFVSKIRYVDIYRR